MHHLRAPQETALPQKKCRRYRISVLTRLRRSKGRQYKEPRYYFTSDNASSAAILHLRQCFIIHADPVQNCTGSESLYPNQVSSDRSLFISHLPTAQRYISSANARSFLYRSYFSIYLSLTALSGNTGSPLRTNSPAASSSDE